MLKLELKIQIFIIYVYNLSLNLAQRIDFAADRAMQSTYTVARLGRSEMPQAEKKKFKTAAGGVV